MKSKTWKYWKINNFVAFVKLKRFELPELIAAHFFWSIQVEREFQPNCSVLWPDNVQLYTFTKIILHISHPSLFPT